MRCTKFCLFKHANLIKFWFELTSQWSSSDTKLHKRRKCRVIQDWMSGNPFAPGSKVQPIASSQANGTNNTQYAAPPVASDTHKPQPAGILWVCPTILDQHDLIFCFDLAFAFILVFSFPWRHRLAVIVCNLSPYSADVRFRNFYLFYIRHQHKFEK